MFKALQGVVLEKDPVERFMKFANRRFGEYDLYKWRPSREFLGKLFQYLRKRPCENGINPLEDMTIYGQSSGRDVKKQIFDVTLSQTLTEEFLIQQDESSPSTIRFTKSLPKYLLCSMGSVGPNSLTEDGIVVDNLGAKESYIYILTGCISGTGRHAICFSKRKNKWYKFDDLNVTKTSYERVLENVHSSRSVTSLFLFERKRKGPLRKLIQESLPSSSSMKKRTSPPNLYPRKKIGQDDEKENEKTRFDPRNELNDDHNDYFQNYRDTSLIGSRHRSDIQNQYFSPGIGVPSSSQPQYGVSQPQLYPSVPRMDHHHHEKEEQEQAEGEDLELQSYGDDPNLVHESPYIRVSGFRKTIPQFRFCSRCKRVLENKEKKKVIQCGKCGIYVCFSCLKTTEKKSVANSHLEKVNCDVKPEQKAVRKQRRTAIKKKKRKKKKKRRRRRRRRSSSSSEDDKLYDRYYEAENGVKKVVASSRTVSSRERDRKNMALRRGRNMHRRMDPVEYDEDEGFFTRILGFFVNAASVIIRCGATADDISE